MRILVDMDGVLADWGSEWDKEVQERKAHFLPLTEDQRSFNLFENRSEEEKEVVRQIMNSPGFYSRLGAIPGAAEALNEMLSLRHDVRIVTAPWLTNPTCASDKYDWAERHIGAGWGERTIITKDKTLIRGDYLIDDKPEIVGIEIPEWEHIWFTQPYNRDLNHYRRIDNWSEWKDVIHG